MKDCEYNKSSQALTVQIVGRLGFRRLCDAGSVFFRVLGGSATKGSGLKLWV